MGARTGSDRRVWLYQQRCVRCGCVSSELQATRTATGELVASSHLRCPRCEQDLYTRPARSYAEMEGLIANASPPRVPPSSKVVRSVRPRGAESDNEALLEADPDAGRGSRHGERAVMRPWVLLAMAVVTMSAVVVAAVFGAR